MALTLDGDLERDKMTNDVQELKQLLIRIKLLEEKTKEIITRIESKK